MRHGTFTSLDALATALGLPREYLRQLAETRAIPVLHVRGRLRFDPDQVQDALRAIAASGGKALTRVPEGPEDRAGGAP